LDGIPIGELSRLTGVNIETIRYYEKIKMLQPPPRTEGGRRVYGPTETRVLAFIRRGRELGFGLEDIRALCSGPGKLCAALGVTGDLDGHRIDQPPFRLILPKHPSAHTVGRRIGITKAPEVPWRFGVTGSRFLSKPFPQT